jgi:hypothetical protein
MMSLYHNSIYNPMLTDFCWETGRWLLTATPEKAVLAAAIKDFFSSLLSSPVLHCWRRENQATDPSPTPPVDQEPPTMQLQLDSDSGILAEHFVTTRRQLCTTQELIIRFPGERNSAME